MTLPSRPALILLLALMGLLNSFGSDILIPALSLLRQDLGSTDWQAQQSISLFFIASAFVSLWYGAISDAYGRRRTILAALFILSLSSAASVFAQNIEQIWVLRIVQGLAAGAGMVISRSILNDLHQGFEAQRLLGRITMIQTLSIVVTPVFGAWLSIHYGWRMVFAALSSVTLILAVTYWHWLPETLPPNQRLRLNPAELTRAFLTVLGTPSFVRLSLAHVANWTSMAVYTVSAPIIVIDRLGRAATDIYLVYGPITLGLIAGFLAFPRLLKRRQAGGTLKLAYLVLGAAVLFNLMASYLFPTALINIAPLFIYSFGLALALPLLIAGALEPLRRHGGVAASCQTFLQFAMIALAAGVLAPWLWDSLFALAIGTGCLTLLGGISALLEQRAKCPAVAQSNTQQDKTP